jgi:hypothetical protein
VKKLNIFRNKKRLDMEIELFCQGTKEVLAKISEKKLGLKKVKSKAG